MYKININHAYYLHVFHLPHPDKIAGILTNCIQVDFSKEYLMS